MDWAWLTGPLVGGVIGYITNDIAVRMMFRPHKEKRLFGRKMPFTPGLIPRERPRLARAIRDVLSDELLSPAVLEGALLSERMLEQVGEAADAALIALKNEARTPRMLLTGLVGEEALESAESRIKRAAGIFIMEKLLESGIERIAAEAVVAEAKKRVAASPAAVLKLFWDDKRDAAMEEKLRQTIRELIATHGPAAIDGMLENTAREGLDTPIGDWADRYGDALGDVRGFLVAQYTALIQKGLPGALASLDLGAVVEDKLNALDMAELEALIMQVMKKELRAIVWLGALLGAVMGVVMAVLNV
ncbi:MAG: DUF445 family protein [Oscillospiraceae bacterium]|jgi:uncharacterized membrane protein YheB (UPF0754 family)|nr:DUF445 family protein [Oscillospiraceae bacterium]